MIVLTVKEIDARVLSKSAILGFGPAVRGRGFMLTLPVLSNVLNSGGSTIKMDWVFPISSTARSTIRAFRFLFGTHGLPEEIHSDNGPQFVAHKR